MEAHAPALPHATSRWAGPAGSRCWSGRGPTMGRAEFVNPTTYALLHKTAASLLRRMLPQASDNSKTQKSKAGVVCRDKAGT